MIWPLGVGIARISGLLTKTSSGAYAAETAKIPGNGTRSSLFYIVQKSPLTLSPGSPPPGLTARSPGRCFRDEFAGDSLLQRRVMQTIGSGAVDARLQQKSAG